VASYSADILDQIRTGLDLVELIGRFVNLRPAGANWKGLCPFHAEKTPSFNVNPRKGIFKCFGCGVGGDAFVFLMRQDKLTFPEAVRELARRTGVALPEERAGAADRSGREDLYRAMEHAARLYAEALARPEGARAREYLDRRGVDPELARRFGLGLAPEGWEFLSGGAMRAAQIGEDVLVAAGLAAPRPSGHGVYDRFRGRLIFPIRDLQGRVVALGGRALGDEQPKYLNSPETAIYAKGNLLYAADLAREAILAKGRALLVEGYVDCLMAHQHGFTETVAALGTAFTAAQLALIRRFCGEVILFFDADAAGQKAAERAEELLEPTAGGAAWGINRSGAFDRGAPFKVRVALLEAGHDPDTFLRAHGAEAFAARLASARSILSYALDRAVVDPGGAAGPRTRASAFARVALLLAKVGNAEEATALSREAALKLGVDPTQLWIESQRLQGALSRPTSGPPPPRQVTAPRGTTRHRDLVTLLLHSLEARRELLPLMGETDLGDEALRQLVGKLRATPDADAATLMTDLGDEARNLLAALLIEERRIDDLGATIRQFKAHLARVRSLREMREDGRRIAEAQEERGVDAPVPEAYRSLYERGRQVHAIARGVPPALEHGTPGPRRSPDE
jgi:DNA primase